MVVLGAAIIGFAEPIARFMIDDEEVIVRGSVAAVFLWLGYSVEWIFAALIVDYIVKATMLVIRFRRGRWKSIEI